MSTEPYTDDELRHSYEVHLKKIDGTEIGIRRLGLYALFNHTKYNIFIEAIQSCFEANVKDLPMQLAYIHLVNEIVQKESPENVKLFLPLIEKMMVKAGATKDQNHIFKAKRVLSILDERKIIDSKFAQRVNALIDFNAKSGEDEDSGVLEQFYSLIDRLNQAKKYSSKMIIDKKSDDEINAAIQKEKKIRTELTDFYSNQINLQYAEIEKIDKKLDDKKKNELEDLVGESDSSSTSD